MLTSFTEKFSQIYKKLSRPSKLGIALSGGIDSMALLSLVKKWNRENQVQIIALTVDHRLRSESSKEALEISKYCKAHNIIHHTLVWNHKEITSAIQEKAREARYKLLSEWAQENNVSVILTAHHLGDQIEQFLISLSQGAGLYSYSIKQFSRINNILFVRPLLDFTKRDLEQYNIDNHISWWEDSSNTSYYYLRNKLRSIAEEFLKISDKKRVITSISNIERATKALDSYSEFFIKNKINIHEFGFASFSIDDFRKEEEEIRFSVLRKIILLIGGRDRDIRLRSIMEVNNAITLGKAKTLGGCEILLSNNKCIIIREFGKKFPTDVSIEKDKIWDNRFQIYSNIKDYKISYIKKTEVYKILRTNETLLNLELGCPKNIKIKIILTLPCVRHLEKIVAIPHISYYDNNYQKQNLIINLIK